MAGRLLKDLRGYNVHLGLFRTPSSARGLPGAPNTFDEVRGDGSTEMSYEQLCAALEDAGVNLVRVKVDGRHNPISVRAASFATPPVGTYNYWTTVLNPANLTHYRANQHAALRPSDPAWRDSNLGQLVLACDWHGVKLDVLPFHNSEFMTGWQWHPWNAGNRYFDGTPCRAADRGWLTDAKDAFADPRALDAARARVDAILAAFEGYEHVVGCWELMAEQTWLTSVRNWPGMTWGDAAHRKLIDDLRNWNEALCRYVQSIHSAPVGVSVATPGSVRNDSIRATLFDAPSLDWVGVNWYDDVSSAWSAHRWLRDAQARYPGRQIIVQQYHPSGPDTVPNEAAPWRVSKQYEWTAACGGPGMVGAWRWMDIQFGTYASPWMREIAGVTARMAAMADLDNWGPGRSWDGRVSSPDMNLASTWCDGRRLVAFLRWASGGAKPVAVDGLADGQYAAHWFDYLEGDNVHSETATSSGGTLTLPNAVRMERHAALLLVPAGTPVPPSPSSSPSPSPSPSSSRSPSASASASPSASASESGSASPSPSGSASESGSPSESASPSPSQPTATRVQLVVTDAAGARQTVDLEAGEVYSLEVVEQ
jgi:hypothetical protein